MVKKLRITASQDKTEQIIDIEEARNWDFFDPTALVVVENQLVRSYQELLDIASTDKHKDEEVLDVHFMVTLTGG